MLITGPDTRNTASPPPVRRRRFAALAALVLVVWVGCETPMDTSGGDPSIRRMAGGNGRGGKGCADITVDGVDPNEVEQGTIGVDLTVMGTGFEPGTTVSFELNGKAARKLTTNSTTVMSSTELIANVDVAIDAEAAQYDVVAQSGRTKGIGSELLRVKLGGPFPATEPLRIMFDDSQTGLTGDGLDSDGDGQADPYDHKVDGVEALFLVDGNVRLDPVETQGPRCVMVHIVEDGDADGDGLPNELLFGPTCLDPDWMTTFPIFGGPKLRDMPADGLPHLVNGNFRFRVGKKMIRKILFGRDECLGFADAVGNDAKKMTVVRVDNGTPADLEDDIWTLSGDRATFCVLEEKRGNEVNVVPPVDVRVPFVMTIRKLVAVGG